MKAIKTKSSDTEDPANDRDLSSQVEQLKAELNRVTLEKNFLQRAMQDLNFHDNAHDGIVYTDQNNRIIYANPYFLEMMGVNEHEELLNKPFPDYMWNNKQEAKRLFKDIRADGFVREREMALYNRDGDPVFAMCSGVASTDNQGNVVGSEIMFCNITSKRMFQAELMQQTALLEALLESTPDPILILDMQMRVERSTPAAQRLFRLKNAKSDKDLFSLFSDIGMTDEVRDELRNKFEPSQSIHYDFELHGRHYDLHAAPLKTAEKGWVCLLHDVTERKRTEESLQYRAFHDILTQLPNRAYFLDKLSRAIVKTRESENASFAVLFIDLDKLKSVNDRFGHHMGDQFLVEFARRLQANIRPGDLAGRLGGDEFAVFLDKVDGEAEALKITKRMHAALQKPFKLMGKHVVNSQASIGIALFDPKMHDAEEVLHRADQAMYRAKQEGGNTIRL